MPAKSPEKAAAKAAGQLTYFNGSCKHGHNAPRYVSNGRCVVCVDIDQKKYYSNPPEHCLERKRLYMRKRQQENPEALREISRRTRERHRERYNAMCRERHQRDRDRRNARRKESYQNNPERERATKRAYYERRKADLIEYARMRENALKQASWEFEREQIREFYRNCPEGYEVDHIIPLRHPLVSGLHCLANLQYLPRLENRRKTNKWDPDW